MSASNVYTTIKSCPTMISPLKYFATGSRQVSSLMLMLSIAGVRCDSTSVLTPASCAMRPTSSERRVIGFHVRHEGLERDRSALGDLVSDVFFQGRHVHGLVHQHVSALGELRDCLARRGVAGKRDRAILEVEAVGQRRLHGRMRHDGGRDLDVVVLHHGPGRRDLVHVDGGERRHLRSSAQKSTVVL